VADGAGRRPLADRFWQKVNRSGHCWLWTASLLEGYGQIFAREFHWKRAVPAHRVAWFLATGYVPGEDDVILHTCDVRPCVRNDDEGTYRVGPFLLPRRGHLALGTDFHNMRDMLQKGRQAAHPFRWDRVRRGELNGCAKITADDVRAIRALDGSMSHEVIAAHFGISGGHVSAICRRIHWKHVE